MLKYKYIIDSKNFSDMKASRIFEQDGKERL